MQYKLCNNGEARTQDYVGTIVSEMDSELQKIKENVKRHNKETREVSRRYGRVIGNLWRVRLMPRGSRVAAVEDIYGKEHKYRRRFDSYLPMDWADSFDVYVGTDSSNTHELKRELDTGMTPGELKRIDKLKNEMWKIEIEGIMRKRRNDS